VTAWPLFLRILLLWCLSLSTLSCSADLADQLGSANPTLNRLVGPGRAEILRMAPSERYRSAYKRFLSETANLARGAEEQSELRARNAATRIVSYLVLMLGAVSDSAMEGRIVDAMRAFIRLGESLVLGRREPGKALHVRRLRDRWGEALHPINVVRFAPSPSRTMPSPPPRRKNPKGGKGQSSQTNTANSSSKRQ